MPASSLGWCGRAGAAWQQQRHRLKWRALYASAGAIPINEKQSLFLMECHQQGRSDIESRASRVGGNYVQKDFRYGQGWSQVEGLGRVYAGRTPGRPPGRRPAWHRHAPRCCPTSPPPGRWAPAVLGTGSSAWPHVSIRRVSAPSERTSPSCWAASPKAQFLRQQLHGECVVMHS